MAAVHSLRTQAGGESFNSAVQFRLIYVLGVATAPSTFLKARIRTEYTLDDHLA